MEETQNEIDTEIYNIEDAVGIDMANNFENAPGENYEENAIRRLR